MNTFDCRGKLVAEAVIGKRHVWLWHITSDNGVVEMYLLQYEHKDMEISDELYSGRDVPDGVVAAAFEDRVREITREQIEDAMSITY